MQKFYRKEIPELPVYVHGAPLRFEVLATEDSSMIVELDLCITKGRGGIISITEEQYTEEVKKKGSAILSGYDWKHRQQRQELSALHLLPNAADAVSAQGGSIFANPQLGGREHKPHNRPGLPTGTGPSGGRAMPDPIEVPSVKDLTPTKPPTAKMSEVAALP